MLAIAAGTRGVRSMGVRDSGHINASGYNTPKLGANQLRSGDYATLLRFHSFKYAATAMPVCHRQFSLSNSAS
jgi:hypothetical protein